VSFLRDFEGKNYYRVRPFFLLTRSLAFDPTRPKMALPPPSSCPTFITAHGLAMAYHYILGAGDASVRTAAILDSAPCPKLDEHFTAIDHIKRLRTRVDDFGNTLRDQGFGARKLTPLPLFTHYMLGMSLRQFRHSRSISRLLHLSRTRVQKIFCQSTFLNFGLAISKIFFPNFGLAL
jgi:hypothetical protein